jgi:hypothetical protein
MLRLRGNDEVRIDVIMLSQLSSPPPIQAFEGRLQRGPILILTVVTWIPAFAGMTMVACAGMTMVACAGMTMLL